MAIKNKIISDLKQAMKEGDAIKRDTLRMLDAMIKNSEIEKKKKDVGLTDDEILETVARAVKQRRDAAQQFESGGRVDLADKEKKEMEILLNYLPEQMGEEEARKIVKEIIAETGSVSKSEIGKVMGAAMGKLKGKIDGQLVKKIVEEELV